MHKNRSAGFTLIELLVVIAIIGILSAVVLASLSTARNKGSDAAIQSDLSTIQTQAEIYYGSTGNNSYGATQTASCAATAGTLFADLTIARTITAVDLANGAGAVACNSITTTYAVSSALQYGIGGNMFWCVDSTGNAQSKSGGLPSGRTDCSY